MKLLYVILFTLFFIACNATIEEQTPTINTTPPTPVEQDFSFIGADSGDWVSNTRAYVQFKAANGGSGLFKYELQNTSGVTYATATNSELTKDSNGFYSLTAKDLIDGTGNTFLVRATDLTSNIQDTNTKTVTVQLPNDTHNSFEGITNCNIFPGSATQLVVNWVAGKTETTAFGYTNDSVGSYSVWICEKSEGTDCIFDENHPQLRKVVVSDPFAITSTISALSPATDYFIAVHSKTRGNTLLSIDPVQERNRKYLECRTGNGAATAITFNGISGLFLSQGEQGSSNAGAEWTPATGTFSGYMIFHHPVADINGIFDYNHAQIQNTAPGAIGVLDNNFFISGMDPFAFNAVSVKACPDLINTPDCSDGVDNNAFLVIENKPDIAAFSGISNVDNDPNNASRVIVNFTQPDSHLGIYDEIRFFVRKDGVDYDISATNSGANLGSVYPAAPASVQSLYLDGYNKLDKGMTNATMAGLQAGQVYEIYMLPYVNRTVVPSGGGTRAVEYTDISMIATTTASNTDTTPPSITSVVANPLTGYLLETQTLTFTVTFDENIIVTGIPTISVDVGGIPRDAVYSAGANPKEAIFTYTVAAGHNDTDGLSLVSSNIQLVGATISDAAGNAADLGFTVFTPNLAALFVDTTPPNAPTNVQVAGDWINSPTSPLISWTNPASDFDHAEVSIGVAPGATTQGAWVASNNSANHTYAGLTPLVECSGTYYANVRSVDPAGLISSEVTAPTSFKYDATAPSTPSSISFPGGETVNINIAKEVAWTSSNDNCQFDHYELAIGYDQDSAGFGGADINNTVDWTLIPGGPATLSYTATNGVDGFSVALTPGLDYYISIRGVDAAGNASAPVISASWNVDILGPNAATGLAISSGWTTGDLPVDSPVFSWVNPVLDFHHNLVRLGTTPGGDEVVADTNVAASTAYTYTGLTGLTECTTYYPTVTSYDAGGNASPPATFFGGFKWDNTDPALSGSIVVSNDLDPANNYAPTVLWPAATDNCSVDHYEIAIGWTIGGSELVDWTSVGNVTTYQARNGVDGFSFDIGYANYYTSIRAVDGAGRVSAVITSAPWRRTDSPIVADTNLALWLDASDASSLFTDDACTTAATGTDSIGCWRDLGVHGNHVIQATASRQPALSPWTKVTDGKAVQFTGGAVHLAVASNPSLQIVGDMTIFIVKKSNNVSGGGRQNMINKAYWREFAITNETNGRFSWYWGGTNIGSGTSYAYHGATTNSNVNGVHDVTTFERSIPDPAAAGSFNIFVNNIDRSSGGNWRSNPLADNHPLMIGDGYVNGYQGQIAELLIFSKTFTTAEKQAIRDYLDSKWNLD